MKTTIVILCLAGVICHRTHAKSITLSIDSTTLTNSVAIGTNEVAELKTYFDSASSDGSATILITKDGRTFSIYGSRFSNMSVVGRKDPVFVAGPAVIALAYNAGIQPPAVAFITLTVTPESFPPGLTVILPEGTVGVIHLESSTNLVQWQDEWVNTFGNTNQNRFFRIRAERSLP